MTGKADPETIVEFVDSVSWAWLALAFALGLAGGIVVLAFVARDKEGTS